MAEPQDDEDDDREDQLEGEETELPDEDDDIEENEDGSVTVIVDKGAPEGDTEHYANLAEVLPEDKLAKLGADLLQLIEDDKKSREKRDEQYAEGLRRTGLGDDSPGGAGFNGASKVVHPMLVEASIDFQARAIKELFPPNGPTKTQILGTVTRDKLEKAQRKSRHLNWQLTKQIPEFRPELEQTLSQTPLGGAAYMKFVWDNGRKRPLPFFIPIDEIFLPYAATSFRTAERKTHWEKVTRAEFERRVRVQQYRDVRVTAVGMAPEETQAGAANQKIEGVETDPYNRDGVRSVYECACLLDIENEDETDETLRPYLVSIDDATRQVLSIYRNWEEDDETCAELAWIVEFPFIPWRGAYPIGFTHLIGDLSGTATGALRALLDSAHINNFPGALKLKGGTKGGQTTSISPTEVQEIEGGLNQDDIRKTVMPFPFNPPSTVLFSLLGFVTDAGRKVVQTTFENLADQSTNMPVGTTLALIEQGMTVFSAIHARLHAAMAEVISILCRLNRLHLDDQELLDDAGELLAFRRDYEGPEDVVPVSDPNIFSETQRLAQAQLLVQRSDAKPELYDPRAVEEYLLELTKVPDYKRFLRKVAEPKQMNAVNENLALSLGRPVAAFPDQDHLAHLQVHLSFLQSPLFGSSQLLAPTFIPGALSHLREHLVMWYARAVYDTMGEATKQKPEDLFDEDSAVSQLLDKLVAAASNAVLSGAQQVLEAVPPIIQQAMQLLQALRPPAPQDPTAIAAQAAQAETQRKQLADQQKAQDSAQKNQLEQQRLQQEAQAEQQRQQQEDERERLRIQTDAEREALDRQESAAQRRQEQLEFQLEQRSEDERNALDNQTRFRMNAEDNQTAKELAAFEAATGEKVAVRTGTGVNPGP